MLITIFGGKRCEILIQLNFFLSKSGHIIGIMLEKKFFFSKPANLDPLS